jgi:2-polyprenyl-6-methoxyphenol hydroxylase-like FAD-dependent oxidoreductase
VTDVIVIGGGPIGLAAAMVLAADGREVTVLEKDEQGPPDTVEEVFNDWQRVGVAQFRQAHYLQALFRQLVEANLPVVRERLEKHGGRRLNLLPSLLSRLSDSAPRPDDERFETLTARRPMLERAFAEAAEDTPGVKVLRGIGVEGPLSGPSLLAAVPHVCGVRTAAGIEMPAALVIDATGRRSKLTEWVSDLGGRPPYEESSDAGFAYYTRHFGSRHGLGWQPRGPLALDTGTLRVLTLPADNDTWTIGIVAVAADKPFKTLRNNDTWERVARAVPTAGDLVDGEPLSDVIPMAGVLDRYRRIVVDGRPVVTGIIPVGDSWACTNPTAGRGISLGLAHAVALRDALRVIPDDPVRLVELFDSVTEETLTPFYRDQVERDHRRAAQTRAVIEGRPAPPLTADPLLSLQFAARQDADAARGFLDVMSCLALPEQVLKRPGMTDRLRAAQESGRPPHPPGPTREELVALATA